MRSWVLLAAAVACEVTAALSLKGAIDHPWLYAIVVSGYSGAFALLSVVLRSGMALGVVYGIWGALGVASTALLSSLVFAEPLTAVMVVGLGVVVAGVVTTEISSQRARSRAGHPGGPTEAPS